MMWFQLSKCCRLQPRVAAWDATWLRSWIPLLLHANNVIWCLVWRRIVSIIPFAPGRRQSRPCQLASGVQRLYLVKTSLPQWRQRWLPVACEPAKRLRFIICTAEAQNYNARCCNSNGFLEPTDLSKAHPSALTRAAALSTPSSLPIPSRSIPICEINPQQSCRRSSSMISPCSASTATTTAHVGSERLARTGLQEFRMVGKCTSIARSDSAGDTLS